MKRIILKPGEEERIRLGHPWVYDNEVEKILKGGPVGAVPEELESGETADVESSRKEYLGRAFVNPRSKIIARIYSPSKEGADKGFFKRRIRQALERRTFAGLDPGLDSMRLVFGEADLLPGLIVDCFTGWPAPDAEALPVRPLTREAAIACLGPPRRYLAVQFLCAGVDARRDLILCALEEVLQEEGRGETPPLPAGAAAIIEKSAPVRELEGLLLREGVLRGELPPDGVLIFENGLPFVINLKGGQKTGHYLDQRSNRAMAARYALKLVLERGPISALDAFSYTGGFALHLCRLGGPPGAVQVVCVDSSGPALEGLRRNAALNGAEARINPIEEDAFNFLRAAARRKERFDFIILDPPAFAKSKSALEGALRGYREINLRAINLLKPGGILVTCSCSQALEERVFKEMITCAAGDADRRLHLLEFPSQPPDHPVLSGYEESLYLKCGIFRVL